MKFQLALLLFLMRRNTITAIYESITDNDLQLMVAPRPNISLFRWIRFDGARNLIHKFVYYIMQTRLGADRSATCAFWCGVRPACLSAAFRLYCACVNYGSSERSRTNSRVIDETKFVLIAKTGLIK